MRTPIHPKFQAVGLVTDGLVEVARELIKASKRRAPARTRPTKGATLRPGVSTPLWNALVLAVQPHLPTYGAKSKLARYLDVPPQRIHTYFGARTQAPDAERTLLVMTWLASASRLGHVP